MSLAGQLYYIIYRSRYTQLVVVMPVLRINTKLTTHTSRGITTHLTYRIFKCVSWLTKTQECCLTVKDTIVRVESQRKKQNMEVKTTQGLFVPFFFRWNSVLFEEWVSMSVVWEKPCETLAPSVTLSPEGLLRLGCSSGDRNLPKFTLQTVIIGKNYCQFLHKRTVMFTCFFFWHKIFCLNRCQV